MHFHRDPRLFGQPAEQQRGLVGRWLACLGRPHWLELGMNPIGHRVVNALAPLILVCLLGAIALGF